MFICLNPTATVLGILDTDDNSVDYFEKEELDILIKKLSLTVVGYDCKKIIATHCDGFNIAVRQYQGIYSDLFDRLFASLKEYSKAHLDELRVYWTGIYLYLLYRVMKGDNFNELDMLLGAKNPIIPVSCARKLKLIEYDDKLYFVYGDEYYWVSKSFFGAVPSYLKHYTKMKMSGTFSHIAFNNKIYLFKGMDILIKDEKEYVVSSLSDTYSLTVNISKPNIELRLNSHIRLLTLNCVEACKHIDMFKFDIIQVPFEYLLYRGSLRNPDVRIMRTTITPESIARVKEYYSKYNTAPYITRELFNLADTIDDLYDIKLFDYKSFECFADFYRCISGGVDKSLDDIYRKLFGVDDTTIHLSESSIAMVKEVLRG